MGQSGCYLSMIKSVILYQLFSISRSLSWVESGAVCQLVSANLCLPKLEQKMCFKNVLKKPVNEACRDAMLKNHVEELGGLTNGTWCSTLQYGCLPNPAQHPNLNRNPDHNCVERAYTCSPLTMAIYSPTSKFPLL